jgi:hypothetical protein
MEQYAGADTRSRERMDAREGCIVAPGAKKTKPDALNRASASVAKWIRKLVMIITGVKPSPWLMSDKRARGSDNAHRRCFRSSGGYFCQQQRTILRMRQASPPIF